ncbi:MAG: putative toxin-antitoxin system toxin component, PIN family [Pseudobdellovibrionaceae bacterium]
MSVKRVVVDTNVVISALTAGGTPQKIIHAWITGEFVAVMSTELRQEINSVFNRSKFIKLDRARRMLLGTLFNQALMVLPQPIDEVVFSDENDHFLLELATTGQATFIVTGDKDLLKTKRVKGIEILNPSQFCQKLKIK